MDMFEALGKIRDGVITGTRGLDHDDYGLICNLVGEELVGGMKTNKGYVGLKLTKKGEAYLAFGSTPLSDFTTRKAPWWMKWVLAVIIPLAIGLLVNYLSKLSGWT